MTPGCDSREDNNLSSDAEVPTLPAKTLPLSRSRSLKRDIVGTYPIFVFYSLVDVRDATTLYFVWMDYDEDSAVIANPFYLKQTNSDLEDASSAQGWSIADVVLLRYENGANTWIQNVSGRAAEIRVRAANTAPTATPPKKVNTDEDTAHTFSENDFGFLDADSDALDHVKITSLPGTGKGTLSLVGQDIASASDTDPVKVTATQLANEDLTYTPPPNEFSTGNPITDFTMFTFKVNDGLADSAETTMFITVGAVNDAPVITSGPSTLSVAENSDSGVAVWTYTATDQEGDSFEWSVTETLLSEVDDSNELEVDPETWTAA